MVRKKKASGPKVIWGYEGRIALFAYLDHAIQYKLDFYGTVVGYLKKSLNTDYSIEQIDRKLNSDWKNYGSATNTNNWRDVFSRGSLIIELTEEERADVTTSLMKLEDEYKSTLLSTPRRLRSSSAIDGRQSSESVETIRADGKEERVHNKAGGAQDRSESVISKSPAVASVRAVSENVPPYPKKRKRDTPNVWPHSITGDLVTKLPYLKAASNMVEKGLPGTPTTPASKNEW
jgi:hypothetical protein